MDVFLFGFYLVVFLPNKEIFFVLDRFIFPLANFFLKKNSKQEIIKNTQETQPKLNASLIDIALEIIESLGLLELT